MPSLVTFWKLQEVHQSEAKKQGSFPTGFGDTRFGVKQKEPTGPDQDPVDQNQIGEAKRKNLMRLRNTQNYETRF